MAEKNNSSSSSTEPTFYPPRLWGLDFHFHTFNKLYVADILAMKPYPMYPGAFAYGNHPVFKVDVMGVVVRVDNKPKLFLYSVDDGTGVINCCCWKQPLTDQERPQEDSPSLPPELQSMLSTLQKEREMDIASYELGDLVNVRGKLKVFRDMMEIVAYNHRKIDNPNRQTERMRELPHLYRRHYDKPFVLPCKIKTELLDNEGNGQSAQTCQSLTKQLMNKIQEVLMKLNVAEFSHSDLLQDPEIAELTKQMEEDRSSTCALSKTLKQMEEVTGTVCCRHKASPAYENLNRSCPLEGHIMDILRTECVKAQYKEKGCHFLRVQQLLGRSVQYSKVQRSAVLHVLTRMETNSDVIRVTDRCYMPL